MIKSAMNLVMFDIDGTLTQTCKLDQQLFVKALDDVFGIKDLTGDPSQCEHFTGWGILSEIYQHVFDRVLEAKELDQFKKHFVQLVTDFLTANPDHGQPVPGAVSFLKSLQSHSNISFATGTWHELAHFKLKHAGFSVGNTPLATTSDAISRIAIMTQSYQKACQHYGVNAFDQVTYIGDGIWDAKASQEMNYRFIGIARGEKADKLRSLGAAHVFEDYQKPELFMQALGGG